MVLYVLAIVGGIFGLVMGADRFVNGAVTLARGLGISSLIVGLTVVSLGTSLPELLVTVTATLVGHPHVAVGNVLGSNIANIGLILGVSSLVRPMVVHSQLLRREYPFLLVITAVVWLMASRGEIRRLDGVLLSAGLFLFLVLMARAAKGGKEDFISRGSTDPLDTTIRPLPRSVINLVGGLIVLLTGSCLLIWGGVGFAHALGIWGGVGFAHALGIDDLVIGLTLMAVGTSLPELATTVAATIKKEGDIAVGNVVGSNVFNTLGILGISAMLRPLPVAADALARDFPVMFLASVLLWPICRSWRRRLGRVNRWEGGALLAGYCLYLGVLFRVISF
ncbi:MAG: calcium/sodium antiporter [Deltaproteobacteria bacterium]|nr:calcium/sodium antiporter [Deltaproteobacteria bacterium]